MFVVKGGPGCRIFQVKGAQSITVQVGKELLYMLMGC
jgi:hypothetical protein